MQQAPEKSLLFFQLPVNSTKLKIIIITGLAGSGKSTALNVFEDMGYYTIDNLPVVLFATLLQRVQQGDLKNDKLALVMDCRDPQLLSSFDSLLQQTTSIETHILFFEADNEILLRRFSQLRRKHFLAKDCAIWEGVLRERSLMEPIRKHATIIDTSKLTLHELARKLRTSFDHKDESGRLTVNLLSFGFKHGLPQDSDILWDVRFLPNPYFVPELKNFTGMEEGVASYVLEHETTRRFLQHLEPLLEFVIPKYQEEGKAQLTICIGCTGGRHRSVAITEKLGKTLANFDIKLNIDHRDIDKT